MSVCAQCGASFGCAMADGGIDAPCWCTRLPPLSTQQLRQLFPEHPANACYCLACLQAITEQLTRQD